MNKTKQKIFNEALNLFSVYGYGNVSVKEIAEAVGIRDSSIYKHFKSKKDIFDMIIEVASLQTKNIYKQINIPDINNISSDYALMTTETLEKLCFEIFMFYLKDEIVSKFRKMLTIEQYSNSQTSQLYYKIFIQEPLTYETSLFQYMIESGFFIKSDPKEMAFNFYSPLFLMLYIYDHQEQNTEEILRLIKNHIQAFSSKYRNK
jgi:AcrR family transcriptional regulator